MVLPPGLLLQMLQNRWDLLPSEVVAKSGPWFLYIGSHGSGSPALEWAGDRTARSNDRIRFSKSRYRWRPCGIPAICKSSRSNRRRRGRDAVRAGEGPRGDSSPTPGDRAIRAVDAVAPTGTP